MLRHYVDNLEVEGIVINGIQTATFCKTQKAICGIRITVSDRNEFSTRNNNWGEGEVSCVECIKKVTERTRKIICCEKCHHKMTFEDLDYVSPNDFFYLCLNCKKLKQY